MTNPATRPSLTPADERAPRRAAIASAVGSVIEWYDFALYSAAAALIFNTHFFASDDPVIGLLASFATFAVGYLVRPLGGVVFGHLGDRLGRKTVMMMTLTLMGISTALIGLLPDYFVIGVWAPILLVLLRVLQGLGAGAEYAGAIIMSSEASKPTLRGFYASWSGAGSWLGAALGTIAFQAMLAISGDQFTAWGWRVPFLVSALMLALSIYIREHVEEPASLQAAKDSGATQGVPLLTLLKTEKRRLAVALGSNFLLSGFSYVPQVWMLSYLTSHLELPSSTALAIITTMLLVGTVAMPLFGWLGDRIGRRRVFMFGAAFGVIWPFPMFWLVDTGNVALILVGLLACFVIAVATAFAAQAAFLAELFPPALRYSGVAFARELSGAVLGGLTPLLATALVAWAGAPWPVAIVMMVNAVVSLVAVYFSKYFRWDSDQGDDERFHADTTGSIRVITTEEITRARAAHH